MGFDLKPMDPTPDAPTDEYGAIWGRYNYAGWRRLREILGSEGVSTRDFSWTNDKHVISKDTCLRVAEAIEANLETLPKRERDWLEPHIELWRTCGGYEIW